MKDKELGFSMKPGVGGLIDKALNSSEADKEHNFSMRGDLSQMSAQATFLERNKVSVQYSNVYPMIRSCDVKHALQLIWNSKCEGYHHYDKEYMELGICTKEEFDEYLTKSVERQKREWNEEKKRKGW